MCVKGVDFIPRSNVYPTEPGAVKSLALSRGKCPVVRFVGYAPFRTDYLIVAWASVPAINSIGLLSPSTNTIFGV